MALFDRLDWRGKAAVAAVALVGVTLYWSIPRKADLRSFNPAQMAVLETAMWRDYYAKRYVNLFFNLYLSSRDEFGFSALDSLRSRLPPRTPRAPSSRRARAAKPTQPCHR
jgi:hypothetical protein